jgi:alkylation response protein AidB-like acyl-CoA dehydrogenase
MSKFRFDPVTLPPAAEETRVKVRAFLKEELKRGYFKPHLCSWSTFDAEFSRRAGAAGFIGMTWPEEYGGRRASNFERYVVTEEMLAFGAPCGAHWIADRQSGPQILKHGSERIKKLVLPKIARGECYFGIGMSEPDTGSDLASVRTKAVKADGGWVINGSKIWTTYAQFDHYLIVLARTATDPANRNAGLTQFLADMSAPSITVRPIHNLAGGHEFNEVFFKDHFVPDDMVIGKEGDGWAMVTGELSLERSGPDRFLSDFRLIVELVDAVGKTPDRLQAAEIGRMVSQVATLRRMSQSVAGLIEQGENPAIEASLVKEQGNLFEQEVPEVARRLVACEPSLDDDDDHFSQALAESILHAPSFSLRGGTREILRGVIARGLGLR